MNHEGYVDYVEASVNIGKNGDVVIKPDRNDCHTCNQAGCCLDNHFTCQFFEGFDGMTACSLAGDYRSLMAKSRYSDTRDGVMITWWGDKVGTSFAILLNINEFASPNASPTAEGWYLPPGTCRTTNLHKDCDRHILDTLSTQILKLAWAASQYGLLLLLLDIIAAMDPKYCNSL